MKTELETIEPTLTKTAQSARNCKKVGLHLQKETIRTLNAKELGHVGGGGLITTLPSRNRF